MAKDSEYQLTDADIKTMNGEGAVYPLQMSVAAARELFDLVPDDFNELGGMLDNAQGTVHSGQENAAFVIIKIVP